MKGKQVLLDTSSFSNHLSASDTTVQLALDSLDDLILSFTVFSSTSDLLSSTGVDGDIVYVISRRAFYIYVASGSGYTVDSVFVYNTADGGNTRWVATGGAYNYYATYFNSSGSFKGAVNVKIGDSTNSYLNVWDGTSQYRQIGWSFLDSDWYVTDSSGVDQTLWHSGNFDGHTHSNISYLNAIDQDLSTTASVIFDRVYTTNYIRTDTDLYIGKDGGGDSNIFFYDDNSNDWRYLRWDDSEDDWRIEDNTGAARTIWHSGNFTWHEHLNLSYLNSINQNLSMTSTPTFEGFELVAGNGYMRNNQLSFENVYAEKIWFLNNTDSAKLSYVSSHRMQFYTGHKNNSAGTGAYEYYGGNAGSWRMLAKLDGDGTYYGYYGGVDVAGLINTDSTLTAHGNIYARSDIYVGFDGGGSSVMYFYDDANDTWRSFYWHSSGGSWRLEDSSGGTHIIYHSGNQSSQHSNYTYLNNINQYLGTSQSPNWRGLTLQNGANTNTLLRVMGGSTNYDATLELMESSTLGARLHYDGGDNKLHFYGVYSGYNEVAWYPRGGEFWSFPVRVDFERSGVSHGFTGIAPSYNFANFDIYETNYGGLNISTFVEDSTVGDMHFVSEHHDGHVYPTMSQSPSSSVKGVFTFAGHKRSGTGAGTMSSGDILFALRNHTSTSLVVTAQGAVYNDVNVYTYFDDEDDIQLIETIRNSIADKPVIARYRKRLEELNIIQNGFMDMGGAIALNMGGIGQLWNMVRKLAGALGIGEGQLLEWSKDYI